MDKLEYLILNIEQIDAFCKLLEANNRRQETLKLYKKILLKFYEYLPEDKKITNERILAWKEHLREEYTSTNSINANISVINSFLNFSNRRDLQTQRIKHQKPLDSPQTTRSEYLRLLQAAKLNNKERLYLIIKVFATMGLSQGELKYVTAENLRSGYLTGCCKEDRFELFIPSSLKKELNDYARKNGIIQGPIFLTRNGTPVNRNNILAEMGKLSREARVAPEKCNPRSLAKMYVSTREEIDNQMAIAAEREYIRILESEQKVCGWDC